MFALWLSAVVAVTVEGGADGVEVEAVPLPGLVQVVLALRVAHPPPAMISGTLYIANSPPPAVPVDVPGHDPAQPQLPRHLGGRHRVLYGGVLVGGVVVTCTNHYKVCHHNQHCDLASAPALSCQWARPGSPVAPSPGQMCNPAWCGAIKNMSY